ncbi:MAG: adenylate/guanylate cyclase domain-containing protein [Verrucomicrobiota bacterium]
MVATIFVVTFALLFATENKIRRSYIAQFSNEFETLIHRLDESRTERSEEFLSLSKSLSIHPYLINSLREGKSTELEREFWSFYIGTLQSLKDPNRSSTPERGRGDGGNKRPLNLGEIGKNIGMLGVMTLDGEVRFLSNPNAPPAQRRGQARRYGQDATKEELENFIRRDEQQILFIPWEMPDGKTAIQEMVSTPVKDPKTGELLGLFLRGASAETEAQRSLERYQLEFNAEAAIHSGIFLEGQFYSRSMDTEIASALAKSIAKAIPDPTSIAGKLEFQAPVHGEDHLIYMSPISEERSPRPAFQVAAFPLSELKSELSELRIRGSGIGAVVLLCGIAVSFLLGRNLSIPIRRLSDGTRAIRAGELDHRVDVKTKDELGELAESFNEMAEELKQKALYRELLGKVSDESVAQALVSGSLDLELGGELKQVSVLFCDIRGFTPLTEEMDPTRVIELLNTHMTAMTSVVRRHYGVVDKFVGDEIMAVFGGLKSYGNDARNSVECALEMIRERRRLNEDTDSPIEIGIGIATGEVVAGCMGSSDRLNYTVLGSRVNLGARLCGVANAMEVVIDDATYSRLDSAQASESGESIDGLRLKGFSATVAAYRLRADDLSRGREEQVAGQAPTKEVEVGSK